MTLTKFRLLLLSLTLLLAFAANSYADISNAAVLFLRIAPGARAAGMGEAYVAIADDATATHWNPAGLGAYPLADSWIEAKIPIEYRPVTDIATLKKGRGHDYSSYDIWALTAKGLVRYDNKSWQSSEVFNTKTDETVEAIVARYFNLVDEEKIKQVASRVARANIDISYDSLVELRDTVLAHALQDYSALASLVNGFDSLLACYGQCRLDGNQIANIRKTYEEGFEDSVFTEREMDRINIAVEKSKKRFIVEELMVPYSALFDGAPTDIASNGEVLLVGTVNGLYQYSGNRWRNLTRDDGLPSMNIQALCATDGAIIVGTDSGMVFHNGMSAVKIDPLGEAPVGKINAIGASGLNNVYTVIDNNLYHYNGFAWSDSREYTVALDDTRDKVADRLAVYGTQTEREYYRNRLDELLAQAPVAPDAPGLTDLLGSKAATEAAAVDSTANATATETVPADSGQVEEAQTDAEAAGGEEAETEAAPAEIPVPVQAGELSPGTKIRIPLLAGIKGGVNDIYVTADGRVWLGTGYGVVHFDGSQWSLPGYQDYEVAEGQTYDDLVAMRADADRAFHTGRRDEYVAQLKDVNDLDDAPFAAGQVVKVYAYPNAYPVLNMERAKDKIYFATEYGMLVYDGKAWSRADVKGLGDRETRFVQGYGEQVWFVGADKMITGGKGRMEFALMHVNWLPELADDLYYDFFGFVFTKDGLGTFGGNLTFISYGTINRTGEGGIDLGTFESFDLAATISYGTSLTSKLKGGVSAKIIHSRLADQGAGEEQGKGTSTGFAVDFGLLYKWSPRLTFGLAVTNLGPQMKYIDAAQADDLPRNLSFGVAYKIISAEDFHLLATVEANKMLVGMDDSFSQELKEVVLNGGAEVSYLDIVAARIGYIYDQEGQVKALTLGFGLQPLDLLRVDAAYIPSSESGALNNTLRLSLAITP